MKKKFRVGEQIKFRFCKKYITGTIIEDRGKIGVGGRRLWRIEFNLSNQKPSHIELPEIEISKL